MDLDNVLTALTTVVGMGGAYLAGRKARRVAAMAEICPCGHAVSFHEDGTGRCHARKPFKSMPGTAFEMLQCDCRIYAGPELVRFLGRPELPRSDL